MSPALAHKRGESRSCIQTVSGRAPLAPQPQPQPPLPRSPLATYATQCSSPARSCLRRLGIAHLPAQNGRRGQSFRLSQRLRKRPGAPPARPARLGHRAALKPQFCHGTPRAWRPPWLPARKCRARRCGSAARLVTSSARVAFRPATKRTVGCPRFSPAEARMEGGVSSAWEMRTAGTPVSWRQGRKPHVPTTNCWGRRLGRSSRALLVHSGRTAHRGGTPFCLCCGALNNR